MNAKKLVLAPHIIQMIRQVNSVKDIPYEVAPKETPSISYKLDDPCSSYNWRNWQKELNVAKNVAKKVIKIVTSDQHLNFS